MGETPINVLFIEDSDADVELALLALRRDGLEVRWRLVETERAMREALGEFQPHAILSDFSMPGFDGLGALRIAREFAPDVPFIFVSGTIGEERAIEAIRLGATDYVLKNNMRRLGTALKRALVEAEERRRIRRAEEERTRLVEILEATSDYVGITGPDGRQIYLNAAGRALTGVRDDEIPGKLIDDIYPPWARELIKQEARPTAARLGNWRGEAAMLNAEGKEVPMSLVIVAHRNPGGGVRFFSSIARDISERKTYEAQIQHLANFDALSGLPNRSLLADRTAQAIALARRSGRTSALVVLNIDRFKLVNEGYGQGTGDAMLKLIGERLQATVREGDTAARLSADTFAVLAGDLARADDILSLVRKLQDMVALPFSLEGRDLRVTLSLGASTFPRDGEAFDVLLRNADAAMHRVKAAGGDGFQFYAAAMTREAIERVELENALRVALKGGQLQLHYQPQVEIPGGRISGVEALMRWRHPTRGWIPPVQFIPLAEETDLIQSLGEWALAEACRQVIAWDRAGMKVPRMAVNVSARQFRSANFVEVVDRALRSHEVDPARLELELTESVLIEDREPAIATLSRLKALGVRIAVDDFGTGYSSLSYLSGLPLDCLKIDRSFVVQTTAGGRDAAIAQAIISLAHALELRVLAEGVETDEQLQFLLKHRCDECQGYLFARPGDAATISGLLPIGRLPQTRT